MLTFDQIDAALASLGKTRAWLAEASGRSAGSIRSALAPNAHEKHRSQHLLRALSDTIARERAAQESAKPAPPPPSTIVVPATQSQFIAWNKAANSHHQTMLDWAIQSLDDAAANWAGLKVADHQSEYRPSPSQKKGRP